MSFPPRRSDSLFPWTSFVTGIMLALILGLTLALVLAPQVWR